METSCKQAVVYVIIHISCVYGLTSERKEENDAEQCGSRQHSQVDADHSESSGAASQSSSVPIAREGVRQAPESCRPTCRAPLVPLIPNGTRLG